MSSSSNSEKETSSHSSEVLEDVNKRVKDVFDILNRETNRVRKEMEAFDEAAKKLEHVHFSKMLKLNVGGHLFSTSLATLNKDPGELKWNNLINSSILLWKIIFWKVMVGSLTEPRRKWKRERRWIKDLIRKTMAGCARAL